MHGVSSHFVAKNFCIDILYLVVLNGLRRVKRLGHLEGVIRDAGVLALGNLVQEWIVIGVMLKGSLVPRCGIICRRRMDRLTHLLQELVYHILSLLLLSSIGKSATEGSKGALLSNDLAHWDKFRRVLQITRVDHRLLWLQAVQGIVENGFDLEFGFFVGGGHLGVPWLSDKERVQIGLALMSKLSG